MHQLGGVRVLTGILGVLVVVLATLLGLNVVFDDGSFNGSNRSLPTITLGLTAEARQPLQLSGSAFPAGDAGFSAYFRVPGNSGGFGLDKDAVDQALFNDSSPTSTRAGIGTLIQMGSNHTVGSVPIKNIDGLNSLVNLYYDDEGWIVAYLPQGAESSRVWQAKGLSIEKPRLEGG